MSITLGSLLTGLTASIGTSETNLYTNDKRTRAINKSVETILEKYPVPQYVITATLSFSNGAVSIPTDCLRPLKLFTSVNGAVQEYKIINEDDFDNNIYQTAKIYWDTTANAEKIKIYPATTVSLSFRYVQVPTYLTASSDTVRFYQRWASPICELAAMYLFLDSQNYDSVPAKEKSSLNAMAQAWQAENSRFQSPYENSVESVFESKKSLLRGSLYQYNDSQNMGSQDVAWLNETQDTVLVSNYGYVADSGTLLTFTLPATASFGDIIKIQGFGVGGWKIAQNSGQSIVFGNRQTTTGTSGYLASTNANDSLTLICVSENLIWEVREPLGSITYV